MVTTDVAVRLVSVTVQLFTTPRLSHLQLLPDQLLDLL